MLFMALCGNETGHFAPAPEEVEGHALNHLIAASIILSWMEEVNYFDIDIGNVNTCFYANSRN
jgi:hypothetical protein